ncbi:hypothetical protein [Haloarcula brevis]|uniref:hypothetical protein n=1 Tax=Haloarcula brevis TaxID=3111453 RepID=UPI00300ED7D0
MKFSGNILIEYADTEVQTHWLERAGPKLILDIDDISTLDREIENTIEQYIANTGIHYVDDFAGGNNWVTCQFGRIEVPIDRWHCKITGDNCPIQAKIDLTDKQRFLQGCNIETCEGAVKKRYDRNANEFKEDIWSTVTDGDYEGHHHHPGTAPCSFCEDDNLRDTYHLPWEMTRLTDHISDYETARTSVELLQEGVAYKLGNAICSTCFVSLEDSYPEIDLSEYGIDLNEYDTVEYTFKP